MTLPILPSTALASLSVLDSPRTQQLMYSVIISPPFQQYYCRFIVVYSDSTENPSFSASRRDAVFPVSHDHTGRFPCSEQQRIICSAARKASPICRYSGNASTPMSISKSLTAAEKAHAAALSP